MYILKAYQREEEEKKENIRGNIMWNLIKKAMILTAVIVFTFGLTTIRTPAATGTWEVYTEEVSLLKSSQKKIYNKAIKAFDSKNYNYRAVMMLYSRKSEGTDYAFLSLRTSKSKKSPTTSWCVTIINKDKSGTCSLCSINPLTVDGVRTVSAVRSFSGWKCNASSYVKNKTLKPAYARNAFKKALKKYKHIGKLTPVAFFGKKAQSGYYYKGLCLGTNNGISGYYVTEVFKNTKGVSKVISCKPLCQSVYLKVVPSTLGKKNLSVSEKELRNKIVKAALSYVGKTPYRAGGNSLKTGTDCSGFVHLIFAKFNIKTKRSSADFLKLRNIKYKDLLPGDVVVYEHHVAIYIGNDRIVHAKGSKYGTVEDTMWYKSPLGYARIIK